MATWAELFFFFVYLFIFLFIYLLLSRINTVTVIWRHFQLSVTDEYPRCPSIHYFRHKRVPEQALLHNKLLNIPELMTNNIVRRIVIKGIGTVESSSAERYCYRKYISIFYTKIHCSRHISSDKTIGC